MRFRVCKQCKVKLVSGKLFCDRYCYLVYKKKGFELQEYERIMKEELKKPRIIDCKEEYVDEIKLLRTITPCKNIVIALNSRSSKCLELSPGDLVEINLKVLKRNKN